MSDSYVITTEEVGVDVTVDPVATVAVVAEPVNVPVVAAGNVGQPGPPGPQGPPGPPGPQGPAGTMAWSGHGPPEPDDFPDAQPGDRYLDVDTGTVYILQ